MCYLLAIPGAAIVLRPMATLHALDHMQPFRSCQSTLHCVERTRYYGNISHFHEFPNPFCHFLENISQDDILPSTSTLPFKSVFVKIMFPKNLPEAILGNTNRDERTSIAFGYNHRPWLRHREAPDMR